MPRLRLLTAPDCQLCEHSKTVLAALAGEGLLSWSELSDATPEGAAVAAGAPPLRPVLFCDDTVVGYGRLSERRLRRQLRSLGG